MAGSTNRGLSAASTGKDPKDKIRMARVPNPTTGTFLSILARNLMEGRYEGGARALQPVCSHNHLPYRRPPLAFVDVREQPSS